MLKNFMQAAILRMNLKEVGNN